MTVSATTFPIELCRPVVNFVADDQHSLYHLSLASRAFKHEAERSLYHTFRSTDPDHHKAFLTAITLSEDHALLVNTYVFIHDRPLDIETRDLMGLALKAMKNLKCLNLKTSQSPSLADLLSSCTFQLTHLDWVHSGAGADLVPFLQGQVSLRSVYLGSDFYPTEALRSHVLPNLNQICGDERVLENLLPGRLVTMVQWMPGYRTSSEPSAALLDSLRNVRVLVLPFLYSRPPLSVLAPYLKNIEVLKLVGSDDQLGSRIVHMPHLKQLALCLRRGTPRYTIEPMIKRLYDKSDTLIDVETSERKRRNNEPYLFERWGRAAKKPTPALKPMFTGWDLGWISDFTPTG